MRRGRWFRPGAAHGLQAGITPSGGEAERMHLPALGIKGNSHMLMQDRYSD